MHSQEFVDEMKIKLEAQKKKLEEDLSGFKAHEELGDDIDSNVQEVEDDEVSRGVIAHITLDLEKINKALEKITTGAYGTDDQGKDIPEDRLRVLPWADKSI